MSVMHKHKTRAAFKKRFLKRGDNKIIYKGGYTSHRLTRRRKETVVQRSNRVILTNKYIINMLNKDGYAAVRSR